MAISKRTRFEVLKRADFSCQYCGRRAPDVTLEVDHIIPKAKGGGDEPENLRAACNQCNRGKAHIPLDSFRELVDHAQRLGLMRERERLLGEYNDAKKAERERHDQAYHEAWNYWFDVHGVHEMKANCTPLTSFLKHYVRTLPLEEVKEAMQIAYDRHGTSWHTPKYFGGICQRRIARQEGRVTPCTICGKDVVLDPGEEVGNGWFHTSCKERRDG